MRKKIVAGNWKMNKNIKETTVLIQDLKNEIEGLSLQNKKVIIAPSFINLQQAVMDVAGTDIIVSAQNLHQEDYGAYTGEISAEMLGSIGVRTVILGHSERRAYYNETDELLLKKVKTAFENDFEIIFCFGEELKDREENNHFNIVASQLKNVLFNMPSEAFENIILAYEPVWAIGTGKTATADQAQEMHQFVRKLFIEAYGEGIANNISIVYGGSVKPNNAKEIFSKADVDGGLIGGAALVAKDFVEIIKSI